MKRVDIYTDGACVRNPGPGGCAAVLLHEEHERELSHGFRLTTNNRMEIMGALLGLSAVKQPCRIVVHSDSRYVVDSVQKGWAERWRSRGWMRTKTEVATNADLWSHVLDLCKQHDVTFKWVRGHSGNELNERCDQLAKKTADGDVAQLDPDVGYEISQQRSTLFAAHMPLATEVGVAQLAALGVLVGRIPSQIEAAGTSLSAANKKTAARGPAGDDFGTRLWEAVRENDVFGLLHRVIGDVLLTMLTREQCQALAFEWAAYDAVPWPCEHTSGRDRLQACILLGIQRRAMQPPSAFSLTP